MGVFISGREGAGRRKAAYTQRRNAGLCPASHHHVAIAVLDHAGRQANGMQAGCTCRDDCNVGTFETELDGHMTRNHVDDGRRYKKWRNPARATIDQFGVHVFDHWQATNARTNVAADTGSQLVTQRIPGRQATVRHGLAGRSQPEVDEAIHVSGFFFRDVVSDIETLDLTGKLAGKVARIKLRDQINAGFPGQQVGPRFSHSVTHRTNAPQTCHDDTTTTHSEILEKNLKGP